nr:reverse transcriptase domain-containing protein [Tanacetum cinerariifolium]
MVVLVPTRNLNRNAESVPRLVTLKGIVVVETRRITQMLMVRERGLRTNPKVDAIAWLIDSGATTHVCNDRCWFKTYKPVEDRSVHYMGDDHFALVHRKGSDERNAQKWPWSQSIQRNIIKIFYHGLNEVTQEVINAAACGIFLYKTPNQAYQLFKDKVLLKLDWAKNQKSKPSLKKTVAFADEGSSNSDTDKIIARMDVMTMKMDAQYKELQSRSKQPNLDHNDDNTPMSRKEETKFMKPSVVLVFTMITVIMTQIAIIGIQAKESITIEIIINLTIFADKKSGRPSGSLPSNTQPNPKGMLNYEKFLKELVSNKHKLEQISSAFLSDESSPLIQNKVPLKLGDPGSFLISYSFNKSFSCDALADLGASSNLMTYSLYAKLSLETLKPTKMSVRLADISFQYPVGIAENMLIEVGKFTFPVDFVILEMEEDNKVPLILGRPFFILLMHIDVIDEIVEEDFDALFDEENSESESDTEEPPFEKITFNIDYKIKTSLEEPHMDLELKPFPDNLEYAFLEDLSFRPVIISSQLPEQDKIKLISILKRHKQAFT